MQDQDMLNTLLVESQGHLQQLEPKLIELEKQGADVSDETVNSIFRAVHSIKGGFSFMAIQPVVTVAHLLESVMARVRDHEEEIRPELIDALLLGVDTLRTMIGDIEHVGDVDISPMVDLLTPFAGQTGTQKAKAAPEPADAPRETPVEPAGDDTDGVLADAIRHGKHVYKIALQGSRDVAARDLAWGDLLSQWERYGDILEVAPDRDTLSKATSKRAISARKATVIFASVLEADLVAKALGLAPERLVEIDMTGVKKAHEGEAPAEKDRSAPSLEGQGADGVLWVKVDLLNQLMNLAGELVLARNQLLQTLDTRIADHSEIAQGLAQAVQALQRGATKEGADALSASTPDQIAATLQSRFGLRLSDLSSVRSIIQHLDMVTTSLQENILLTRMQRLSVVFGKFPRVVRDIARKLDKQLRLTVEGDEVELDKSIIELLSDPLTHLVRNAADHGIESPDLREKRGKPREGRIELRAFQEGGKVIVMVKDDGAGIDVASLQERAVELGIITPAEAANMTQRELQMLIFAPGTSTARQVSDLSGRGVGMDVVRTNIERLGGSIDIDSQVGEGTTITLQLPLTLAIIPSLIVRAEGRRFAIPQVALEEIASVKGEETANRIERIHQYEVLRLRDELLPLVRLTDVLGIGATVADPEGAGRMQERRGRWSDRRQKSLDVDGRADRRATDDDRRQRRQKALKVAVLTLDNRRYGLVVDDVDDNEEIVVKPLPECMKEVRCYSGATIMGDGRVAMILDPTGIAEKSGLHFEELERERALRVQEEVEEKAGEMELLLFTAGSKEQLAVRLSSVKRIEKLKPEAVEVVGPKTFVRYADSSLRLLRFQDYVPIRDAEAGESEFVLVPECAAGKLGFGVSAVSDTVSTDLELDTDSVRAPGVVGTTVLAGRLVVVLDLEDLVQTVVGQDG